MPVYEDVALYRVVVPARGAIIIVEWVSEYLLRTPRLLLGSPVSHWNRQSWDHRFLKV